jgi:ureidoacrylate peracid hydrolase
MVNFVISPERTALIDVDLQNCFVDDYPFSAPDGLAVLDRINRLAAVCRAAGILVVHTSRVLRPDGSNMGVLGKIAPSVLGRHHQQRRPISGPS